MSRRNMLVIATVALVSAVCYLHADHNRYGRYLTQVLDAVDRWSLEPVPQHDLFDGAMRGIVGRLDEHSTYISAKDTALFEADLEQEFGGIGVMVELEGEPPQLTVVSPPQYGTPALTGGIRVRDRILEIDGVSTAGMTIAQVVGRMRGKKGKAVVLTILHEGATAPVQLAIVRDTINIPSVLGYRRRQDGTWDFRLAQDGRIGYVRIGNFGEKTADEIEAAFEILRGEAVQALVLDLRDNAGGLLTAAVATCEVFLPRGLTIVSIRGRDGGLEEVFTSSGPGMRKDVPIAVLVNRYTASASEIVAACLQDHRRHVGAVVIGERTWGKGTVQHVIPIEAGRSILKLTAASYWRPSGQNIHRLQHAADGAWGVRPDAGFEIQVPQRQQDTLREYRRRRDLGGADGPTDAVAATPPADPVLNKALATLQGILAGEPGAATGKDGK